MGRIMEALRLNKRPSMTCLGAALVETKFESRGQGGEGKLVVE